MTAQVGELLERIESGDEAAAAELVGRYTPMLRTVGWSSGLGEQGTQDLVQTTWLRFFEDPERVREPEHLGGWLRTVATREAWRVSGCARREVSMEHHEPTVDDARAGAEDQVVEHEEIAWLRRAVALLPTRQREVIVALTMDPPLTYAEISERTGMPVGSIGPTRARALETLRGLREHRSTRQPVPQRHRRRPAFGSALAVAS